MAINHLNTILATIQNRRGQEEYFDPDQMTAGEWAVSTDSKKVWMCFQPGLVLRMATYEAFEKDMEEIRQILVEAQDIQAAIEAWNYLAESYAHGGTGMREGEDTDNAKYYSEQAQMYANNAEAVTGIGIMTTEKAGIGKPDGTTITADADGTMHVIGGGGGASGDFASKAIYGDNSINLGRLEGSDVGERSVAYGYILQSTGFSSYAEGRANSSVNNYAHTEGGGNISIGLASHAEGLKTISGNGYILSVKTYNSALKKIIFDEEYENFSESFSKIIVGTVIHIMNKKYINDALLLTVGEILEEENAIVFTNNVKSDFEPGLCVLSVNNSSNATSHSEGRNTMALSDCSHSEGYNTKSTGYCAHSEGNQTKATANQSHAEGFKSISSGEQSHAEGYSTIASGHRSHAEGYQTSSNGFNSHSEGYKTKAEGSSSHAEGYHINSLAYQHVQGHYNNTSVATSGENSFSGASSNTAFCIGNGTENVSSNAARIDYNGKLWCKEAYSSTGADYAELFEWADGNPDNEDRRGYFVTMDGKKVKKASEGDYILGIVSGNPSVIGNTDMEWYGQFMRDEFGTFIKETHKETVKEPSFDEDGNETEVEKEIDVEFYKTNPDYDPNVPYTFRLDRPEWDAVGMLGVLPVLDDGTCEVGRYCRCADGGIATIAETRGFDNYMVIERISDNIVSVILK